MKAFIIGTILLTLTGCTSFYSKETCTPQKDGYAHCAGIAQWEREPACVGGCKP